MVADTGNVTTVCFIRFLVIWKCHVLCKTIRSYISLVLCH